MFLAKCLLITGACGACYGIGLVNGYLGAGLVG